MRRLLCCVILLLLVPPAARAAGNGRFAAVDAVVQRAVASGRIPGAVVLVGHDGEVVYHKAFGWRALEPRREPMTEDTIFDLASLTKSIATAPSVMLLVQSGQVRLNDPVARYIPDFARSGKAEITVRQLLTHFSGLAPDLDLKTPWSGAQTALQLACDATPIAPPGSRYLYSDINYIVLGALVERVSGMPLDRFAEQRIFQPLQMETTRFLPPPAWLPRIAPTEYDEHGVMLRGVVHDPTARRMGGVAGHAGVFSTAADLARLAQTLLDRRGPLSPAILEKMTTPQTPPTSTVLYGFGWDVDSPYSSPRGDLLPVGSFGHTGFTGTSLWIDPTTRTYIIILTNAVHPRGNTGAAVALRSEVADAVVDALGLNPGKDAQGNALRITGYNETRTASRLLATRNGSVELGIDVLEKDDFKLLRQAGKTLAIGLLTNQTGVDSRGRRTIDVLAHAPGLRLAAIFSPEHGVTGALDTTEIGNTRDASTGAPVYSVYGATAEQRHPPLDVLKGLDAVVIDLQDAGVRFYTYETTLGYFLEAAAQAGIPIYVLDRPNPITGTFVQGPMSEEARDQFTNYFPVPVRHGMTLGELATMFDAERHIGATLTVVPMRGWVRGDWLDATGVEWINPSPNLRSLTEATLYPGVGLIEGTNVSVGRGTDTPFELVGAPWANARQLASYLNRREISGVRFVPVSFTPSAGPYAGQLCHGVNLVVLDRNGLDAPELGMELAAALHALYPGDYKLDGIISLLANHQVCDELLRGGDPRRIAAGWSDALENFLRLRGKYLLY
jgi:uncharacterized protein YbbC (DUF1343 family)/CubicO group peptidase (beta-lactamase class C family)